MDVDYYMELISENEEEKKLIYLLMIEGEYSNVCEQLMCEYFIDIGWIEDSIYCKNCGKPLTEYTLYNKICMCILNIK